MIVRTCVCVFILLATACSSWAQYAFHAVTPCRIVDTRQGQGKTGAFGPPSLSANTARTIPIPQSSCNIPIAPAYSLNVTAISGNINNLRLWASNANDPQIASLYTGPNGVTAVAAIVAADSLGEINVESDVYTDLIIDIDGYFGGVASPQPLLFYPITPCRVLDTRSSQGWPYPFGTPSLSASSPRTVPILSSSCSNNIPATAQAYSFNYTVVPPSSGTVSWLSAWPAGQSYPNVSVLNDNTSGAVVANAAITVAGTSGSITVEAGNTTDLIIDINGYFAPPASGGLYFVPVTPCVVANTTISSSSEITVQNTCGIPAAASTQAYSLGLAALPGGVQLQYLSIWPDGTPYPGVSTLNSTNGYNVANAALVPSGSNGAVDVLTATATQVILSINGYFSPQPTCSGTSCGTNQDAPTWTGVMLNDGLTQVDFFQYVNSTTKYEVAQSGAPLNGSSSNAALVSTPRPGYTYLFSDLEQSSNGDGTYEYAPFTTLRSVCALGTNQNTAFPDYAVSSSSSFNNDYTNGYPQEGSESRKESGIRGLSVLAAFGGNVLSNKSPQPSASAVTTFYYSDQQCTFGGHEYGFSKDLNQTTLSNWPGTIKFYYSDHTNCYSSPATSNCNATDGVSGFRATNYYITNLSSNQHGDNKYYFQAYPLANVNAPHGVMFRVQVIDPYTFQLMTCTMASAIGYNSGDNYNYLGNTTSTGAAQACTFDITPPSWFRADLVYSGTGWLFDGIQANNNPDTVGNNPGLWVGAFNVGKR